MEHPLPVLSESEQMYLLTLGRLIEDGTAPPVPISMLAQALDILPVSVNQMVRKLADAGLLTYAPYKGVGLTEAGIDVVRHVVRYRRLWQVFLVERLLLSPDDADSLACRLEHLTSDDLADRLSQYLGDPSENPWGKPIPPSGRAGVWSPGRQLDGLRVGQRGRVLGINADDATRSFLAQEAIRPGQIIAVLAVGSDQEVLLGIAERRVHLAPDLARRIRVQLVDVGDEGSARTW
jgi:DtxR family transcriptional regulator, Mn-dependent transcriptional regulator